MPISQTEFEAYADRTVIKKSIIQAKRDRKPNAFLSHSHKDARTAKGVQSYLQAHGWEVYIDWEDAAMPEIPNRITATVIQSRIQEAEMFLFLATVNSTRSRWCPWEIGYADGVKKNHEILVIPTKDKSGAVHGNEYLHLYQHIDLISGGGIGHFGSDDLGYPLKGEARPGRL